MIKRENHFRVDPRSYPRCSASMGLKFIVALFLVTFFLLPTTTYGALLPQPTGSCPVKCQKYVATEGIPTKCEDKMELPMVCKLGKCVFTSDQDPQEWDIPCNYSLTDIAQSGVNFVTLFLSIAGSLALLMFAYGGYGMLTSVGNAEAIGTAKKRLTGGFIGLIIVLGSVAFVQFGAGLLGASVLSTGEVVLPAAECAGPSGVGNKKETIECGKSGENMVCYKNTCISKCDWYAQTEEGCYSYTCQPTLDSGEGKCTAGLCPGTTGYQCCLSQARINMMKANGFTQAGTCSK